MITISTTDVLNVLRIKLSMSGRNCLITKTSKFRITKVLKIYFCYVNNLYMYMLIRILQCKVTPELPTTNYLRLLLVVTMTVVRCQNVGLIFLNFFTQVNKFIAYFRIYYCYFMYIKLYVVIKMAFMRIWFPLCLLIMYFYIVLFCC